MYVLEKLEYSRQFLIQISLDRNKCKPVIKYMKKSKEKEEINQNDMGIIEVDFLKGLSIPQLLGVAGDLGIDSEKS